MGCFCVGCFCPSLACRAPLMRHILLAGGLVGGLVGAASGPRRCVFPQVCRYALRRWTTRAPYFDFRRYNGLDIGALRARRRAFAGELRGAAHIFIRGLARRALNAYIGAQGHAGATIAMKRKNQEGADKKVLGKETHDGRDTWRVAVDGKVMTIVTSASSTSVMDEALVVYAGALKRLANK